MKLNVADKKDKNEIKNLWAEAFCEQEPFLSWYFDNFWEAKNSLCIKSGENEVVGALTTTNYDISVNGKILKGSYVAGVSVKKSMRMRGIAKKLMEAVLKFQISRNEPISLLIPFNYDFYRKMGYEVCYERIISMPAALSEMKSNNIKKLNFFDVSQINALYERYCKDKNGYILRDTKSWEFILKREALDNTNSIGYFENGKLLAYCIYVKEKNSTTIHEVIGREDAKNALISYVIKNNVNVKVYSSCAENIKKHCQVVPTVMARVTSVLLAMKFLDEIPINIKISDNFIEENNGVYKIGGKKLSDDSFYDIKTDIKYFTQWFMGFKLAGELFKEKKMCGNAECVKMLDKIVKKQTNYINLIMSEDF